MNDFTILTPGSPGYSQVLANHKRYMEERMLSKRRSNSDYYNDLAEKYNAAAVGELIQAPVRAKIHSQNLIKILEGRGLIQNVDYEVSRMATNKDYAPESPLLLLKMTASPMRDKTRLKNRENGK